MKLEIVLPTPDITRPHVVGLMLSARCPKNALYKAIFVDGFVAQCLSLIALACGFVGWASRPVSFCL